MVGGMRRRGSMAAAALVAAGLLGGATAAPAVADAKPVVEASGALTDLAPAAANPTDGASADLWAVSGNGTTTFFLFVSGLDPAAEGNTYGAHIHVGPCVAGNGAAALGHYNTGGTPSPDTEVWLDFTVLPGGIGWALTTVPFQIDSGAAQSLVIHAQPTESDGDTPGAAGARMACLPVPL